MKKLGILTLSILLTACAGGAHRGDGQTVARFDLGPVPAQQGATSGLAWPLVVTAPAWVNDTAIHYRLAYGDPARVYDYAYSRWVGPPAELLRKRLEGRVIGPRGSGQCLMQLELQGFEQVFSGVEQSSGVLTVRAQVRDRGGLRLDERSFTLEVPASFPNASGGVVALVEASDRLGIALSSWQSSRADSAAWAVCWR